MAALIENDDNFINCSSIDIFNVSLISSQFKFRGLPHIFGLNLISFLTLMVIFLVLKQIAWKQHASLDSNKSDVGWIGLLYKDVYDFVAKAELALYGYEYSPIDAKMKFHKMLQYSFFGISDKQVLARCGVDACQYLAFLKYSTHFMIVNTVLCICCILPANLKGTEEESSRDFARTTMTNIRVNSKLLWIHVSCHFILLLTCWFAVRAIFLNLRVFSKSRWTERTVCMKGVNKRYLTSEDIEEFYKSQHPKCAIEDIKLAYKYQNLLYLDRKLTEAQHSLAICDEIRSSQSRELMITTYWCTCYGWLGPEACNKNKINAHHYYESQISSLKEALITELKILPKRVLPEVFVTFKKEYFAHQALSSNICFASNTLESRWKISKAPEPSNIIWENMREENINLNFRTLFINLSIFFLAFFLTTPTIIISSFQLDFLSKKFFLSRFLLSVLVWILSTSIPAIVTYSTNYLEFTTKSSMYISLMRKTVIFLIFTVVILPSLGLTSLSAFTLWSMKNVHHTHKWKCIFYPDNGAFFADYLMTSTFIGMCFELLRIPECLYYLYSLLVAKSEAERIYLRRGFYPWDYNFGVQYSYALLIFTLTVFFSIPCPIISVFGLMYFIMKCLIDRYNIYFAYAPSQIHHEIHVLAIKFLMFAMLLRGCGFFFLLYVRAGWRYITYAASCIMWLNIIICLTTINPCNWKFVPPCNIMPTKNYLYTRRKNLSVDEKELFQPKILLKYISVIESLDKYNNPIESKKKETSVENIPRNRASIIEYLGHI